MEKLEQELPVPNISIEEISEITLNTIASIIEPGENGENARLDLDVFSPVPVFIGMMAGLCDAYTQLYTTEERRVDYVHALSDIQSMFMHFLIDKNIDHALENQGLSSPMEELTEPVQLHDPNC